GGGDDVSFSSDSVRFCEGQQQQEFPDVPANAGSLGGLSRNAGPYGGSRTSTFRNGTAAFTPDGAREISTLRRGTSSNTFDRVSGSGNDNGNARQVEPGSGGTLGTSFRAAPKAAAEAAAAEAACRCSANQGGASAVAGEAPSAGYVQSTAEEAETNEENLRGHGDDNTPSGVQQRVWGTGRRAKEEEEDGRAAAV
ncbi:unnamed protein product, partial [Laminaria digitata]